MIQQIHRLSVEEGWPSYKIAKRFHIGRGRAKAILDSFEKTHTRKPNDPRPRCRLCNIILEKSWMDDGGGNITHEAEWAEDGVCWMCEEERDILASITDSLQKTNEVILATNR